MVVVLVMFLGGLVRECEVGSYFWRHEFGGTAKGTGGCVVPHVLFAKTVVANLDMPI